MFKNLAKPIVKAKDVAYIRFSAPDLDVMEAFCRDFGLIVTHRDQDCLYSRGLEGRPFIHVVHRGPPKCIGLAFEVDGEEDLHRLAAAIPGCSPVHDIAGLEGRLGGGRRVHFVEPNTGFVFEAVHGQQVAALTSKRERQTYNHGGVHDRLGKLQDVAGNRLPNRADPGPPEILRMGHAMLVVPPDRYHTFLRFLMETFGMLISDAVEIRELETAGKALPPELIQFMASSESKVVAAFMRMDRGQAFTDQHSMFVIPLVDSRAASSDGRIQAQLGHVAFEVFCIDDVFRGHMTLRMRRSEGKPYALAWGVGRHVYGSQVFDYWADPYGHVHEHMCDGDRLNAEAASHFLDVMDIAPGGGNQWGPTTDGTSVHNVNGPQCAPQFEKLSQSQRASVLSRDLSEVQHVLATL